LAVWYKTLTSLEDGQFRCWQQLLQSRMGFWLPEQRRSFLQTALSARMRAVNCLDYDLYYEGLSAERWGAMEWIYLVDLLTVHESRFFRDPAAMLLVEEYIEQRLQQANEKPLVLESWSLGCSTGQEPYSLAMLMESYRQQRQRFYYGITGTDVSFLALARAREARFGERDIQFLPDDCQRYTSSGPDGWRIIESIRERVRFVQGNILTPDAWLRQLYDIVFCQNVLIYIAPEERSRVLERVVAHLAPGGLLVLGAGEVLGWSHPRLTRVKNTACLAYVRQPSSEMKDA
jgi:type IV pilus assembly protein PilK